MNESGKFLLENLKKDFKRITETTFNYFYCPILFCDEETELCKGHIVNQAFGRSHSEWIIQRKDVDNFYGIHFEADFIGIQYIDRRLDILNSFSDRNHLSLFRPKITRNGQPVPYYPFSEKLKTPKDHTPIIIESAEKQINLNLKISKEELENPGKMEIYIEKDMRLSAIVSLLKAAHLTLFKMLKYQYALSATGYYMGKTILGDFFIQNRNENHETIIQNGLIHFEKFSHLVRPMTSHQPELKGTIKDNRLYILETSTSIPWAFMIFIKVKTSIHAVIIPIFEHPDGISKFFNFLRNQGGDITGKFSYFDNGTFMVHEKSSTFNWPHTESIK